MVKGQSKKAMTGAIGAPPIRLVKPECLRLVNLKLKFKECINSNLKRRKGVPTLSTSGFLILNIPKHCEEMSVNGSNASKLGNNDDIGNMHDVNKDQLGSAGAIRLPPTMDKKAKEKCKDINGQKKYEKQSGRPPKTLDE
uniref:Uncharacterized protein n=1 Tax=Solanum tuberosum TaxID=4113 RepID=M1DLW6_SOLTU